MRHAIVTRTLAPIHGSGIRIKVKTKYLSMTVLAEENLTVEQNHIIAAKQFCKKHNMPMEITSGFLSNGDYVHLIV